MADPLLPNPEALDQSEGDSSLTDFVTGRRLAAQAAANQGLDGSADDAARAQQIGHATGDNASLIYGDLDNYQRQHKALLTSELIKNNQTLRDYALAHPLNATISNDDWGQLDNVSQAIKRFGEGPIIKQAVEQFKAQQKGFMEGWGDEELGSTINRDQVNQFLTQYPNIARYAARPLIGLAVGGEILSRLSSGAGHALLESLVEAQKQMGFDEQRARYRANDIVGMLDSYLQGTTGAPHIPEAPPAAGAKSPIEGAARHIQGWMDAGKHPLGGVPEVDQAIAADSKLQLKNLDDVVKETGKSSTFERSQEFANDPVGYRAFLESHPEVRGRMIGISQEGMEKLYPEGSMPEAGDGKLGDVPGIAQAVERARVGGGDVEIPLANMIMNPDVYDEVKDHIRTHPAAMTMEETKDLKAPMEAEPDKPMAAVPADAVRTASGLDTVVDPWGGKPSQDFMPETAKLVPGGEVESGGLTKPVTHTFPVRDIINKIDPSGLEGVPRALYEFFKEKLTRQVGDTPVYMLQSNAPVEAYYSPRNQHIILHPDIVTGAGRTYWSYERQIGAIMEEASHAATWHALQQFPELKGKVELLRSFTESKLRDTPAWNSSIEYALQNPEEFTAWSQGQQLFQREIAKIQLDPSIRQALGLSEHVKSVWEAVRLIVKDLITKFVGKEPSDTVLDAMFRIGEELEKAQKTLKGMRAAEEAERALRESKQLQEFYKEEQEAGAKGGWLDELKKGGPQYERPRMVGTEEPLEPGAAGLNRKQHEKLLEMIRRDAEKIAEQRRQLAEREVAQRQTKEWKENEGVVRDKVTEELRNRPDIAADRFLREGQLYGSKVKRVRLDETQLTDEQKATLSPEHYGAKGMNPDDAAGLFFGSRSGDAMIKALGDLEAERKMQDLTPAAHFNQLRDVETERRMKLLYGKLDENILAEAKEHALSPETMDRLHEQFVAYGMKYGTKTDGPITKEDVKAWAKKAFNETPIKEHDSDKYIAEMGRRFKDYVKADLEERHADAYKALQQHQIQGHLAKLAATYEREQASFDRLKKQVLKRAPPGRTEEFANWNHFLLAKGGLEVLRRDLAERMAKYDAKTFLDFAKEKSSVYGLPMDYEPHVYDDSWRKPEREMTYAEWKGWSGAIRSVDNFAKDATKLRKMGEKIDWEGILRPKLIAQAEKERYAKPTPYNKTRFQKLAAYAKHFEYKFILMDSVWNRLDHGNLNGLFQTTFAYDAAKHVGNFGIALRDFSEDLKGLSKFDTKLDKKVENTLFVHPRTREPIDMNKENVRKVITYLGTKTGEDKVIRGWILPKEYSKEDYATAQAALYDWLGKVSDKKDWDFAQGLWDINEKIFKRYEDMVTEVGGIPAQREELNPIAMHGKKYGGGYVKLQYDHEIEGVSKKLMASFDPEDPMADSGFWKASTPKSHEKARTGYAGPLYLKLDRDNAAMTNVLRDAEIRPFIINASKAFYDNEFRDAIQKSAGVEVKRMLDTYLKNVAGMGPRMSEGDRMTDRVINYFSQNIISRLIGWNVHTVAKHGLSAAVNSLGEVGPMNVAREMRRINEVGDLDPKLSNNDFAMQTSRELPNRLRMAAGTMAGQWDKLQGKSTARDWLAEKSAAPIGYFDLKTAVPTWIAAYKKSMMDQLRATGDFDKDLGISVADRAVRRAHGSTLQSSRPEIMQGGAMARTFTRLYLFFNTMLQRNWEAYWRSKAAVKEFGEWAQTKDGAKFQQGKEDISIAVKSLVMANLAPSLIEEAVTPYSGHDKDNWGVWSAKTLAMMMAGMIPVVREITHAIVGGYPEGLGILDTGARDTVEFFRDLAHGARAFDNEHGGKTIKALNSLVGTFAGYTNDEIGRAMKWGWDVTHQNKDTPHTIYEHARELTSGKPREKR